MSNAFAHEIAGDGRKWLVAFIEDTVTIDDIWTQLYRQTKEVIRLYGKVIVYYVKALKESDWENRVGTNYDNWTEIEVLQELGRKREVIESVGAKNELFVMATKLEALLNVEPLNLEEKFEFCFKIDEFVKLMPMQDLCPFSREVNTEEVRRRRALLGSFYTLEARMARPKSWLAYFIKKFRTKYIAQTNNENESFGPPPFEDGTSSENDQCKSQEIHSFYEGFFLAEAEVLFRPENAEGPSIAVQNGARRVRVRRSLINGAMNLPNVNRNGHRENHPF